MKYNNHMVPSWEPQVFSKEINLAGLRHGFFQLRHLHSTRDQRSQAGAADAGAWFMSKARTQGR
jgi:hypothetical protein